MVTNECGVCLSETPIPSGAVPGRPWMMVMRIGIILVTLCFLVLAEWTIGNAVRNEVFDASVRLAEAAARLRRATDKDSFFLSLSQRRGLATEADRFFSALNSALGHDWKPDGTDSERLVRVWQFDCDGRLIDVHGSAAETADIELAWNGAILKTWQSGGKSLTPRETEMIQRGQAAAQRLFSPFLSIEEIWHASTFLRDAIGRDGQKFRLGVIRNTGNEMAPRRDGWMGYMREDAMDPFFTERRIASVLPYTDVDFCAIQHRGRLMVPKAHRLLETDWRSLALRPDDGTFRTNGFGTFAAFRLPGEYVLALGCKPGRFASIPWWARLAAGALCLGFALFSGREISRFLAPGHATVGDGTCSGRYAETMRSPAGFGLQTRIFAMFFLASWVPLGTLLGIGLSDASDSREAARRLWSSRLFQHVESADRRFRNHLESLQSEISELVRLLSVALAAGDGSAIHRILNERTKDSFGICYSADDRVWSKEQTKRLTGDFTKGLRTLGDLVFSKIINLAPGAVQRASGHERTITLDASDLLGEGHPILFALQGRGMIVRGAVFDRNVSIFWDLLTDAAGKTLGALFVSLMVDNEVIRFGKLLAASEEPDGIRTRLMFNSAMYPDRNENSADLVRMTQEVFGSGGDGGGRAWVNGRQELVAIRPLTLTGYAAFLSMMPYDTILSTFRRRSGAIFGSLLLALLPVVVCAVFLNRRIAGPVAVLTKSGRLVAAGSDVAPLPVGGPAELSTLAVSFNDMVEGIRQRERMRRYLSAAAWEAAAGGVTAERVEVAVMSSDIRGFTTLSERHSAGEIVAMLNDYFTGMERVIRRHGGDIDRFVGDAITAVFARSAGEDEAGHIRRAVLAGVEMRSALAGFNAARTAAGLFTIENGVGIDVGVGVRGLVGAAEGRRDISIIGNIMARAASCEAASKFGRATKIVVSTDVAARFRSGFTWNRLAVPASPAELYELVKPA